MSHAPATASPEDRARKFREYLDWKENFDRRCRRQLRRTAYHEAGHVVHSCARKIPFRFVFIRPLLNYEDALRIDEDEYTDQGCFGGVAGMGMIDCREIKRTWMQRLVNCYAGNASESKFVGSTRVFIHAGDRKNAEELLGDAFQYHEDQVKRDCLTLARLFVDEHWNQIDAVANALIERRYLEPKEVRRIIREAK